METELRKFFAPEFVFGTGARRLAGRYARLHGANRVCVVSDPGVVAAGWTADVQASLAEEGLEHVLFESVHENPRDHEAAAGARLFAEHDCDSIVAVGGGSPMDCAKAIGILSRNEGDIERFEGVDEVLNAIPPIICVPTTGGTAAELSQFAIISIPERKTKIAIVSKSIVPDAALLDPETLTTMDPYLTACTGMDALVHAIEAFVSNASSPMTDVHALEAVRLLSSALKGACENPHDIELRARVLLGSAQAGLAFSNASLGAVHAMAHSCGGRLDLRHGECNAILVPHVVAFNHRASPERFDRIAESLGLDLRGLTGDKRRSRLVDALLETQRALGISTTLADRGVRRPDLRELSEAASRDVCLATNPRPAEATDLEAIYAEAL